jgi:hypothetical protein
MARNISLITSCVLDESARSSARRVGEQALAVEDVGVLGEEAEDQPRHEVVHVVAALGLAPFGVVLQQLDIELVEAAGRPDVEGVSLICLTVVMPASGRKKPKWSGKSLKAQATVSPLVRSSASKSAPSVARMNLAFRLAQGCP